MYFLILISYVPAIALVWYFYHKDKYEPEPAKYIAITFFYGAIVSVGIAMFLERLASYIFPQAALFIALISASIEEPSKALAIRIPYDSKQMDGLMDGVVYGVTAGLGFAATENLLYGLGFGIQVTLIRIILTPFAHGAWSAIVGVGYGLKAEGYVRSIIPFLLLAMFMHFLWNFLIFMSSDNMLYLLLILLLLLINIGIIGFLVYLGTKEDMAKYGID